MTRMKKILYFIDTRFPTPKQWAEAQKIGAQFRCIEDVDTANPEPADELMGCVPDCYAKHEAGKPVKTAKAKEGK